MSANASVTQSREQTGGFKNLKEKKTNKQTKNTSGAAVFGHVNSLKNGPMFSLHRL